MCKYFLFVFVFCFIFVVFLFLVSVYQQGDWIVCGGFIIVVFDEFIFNIVVGGIDFGVVFNIDNDIQLGLNVVYFIIDNINIELFVVMFFKYDVNFFVVDLLGMGNQFGEVMYFLFMFIVNYYFNDVSFVFQLYIGVGINYIFIFDEEFIGVNEIVGLSDFLFDNLFGLLVQVGMDY